MKLMPALGSAIFVILLHGCGSSDRNSVASGAAPGEYRHDPACAATNLKHWAYANLKDYYLFYDQVPTVNPDSYASATELVEALRVQPYDRFSRVALTNEEDEVFVEGQTFGVGVIWQWSPRDNLTVGGVYADSPMGRAGVTRGDWLVSINDTPVENLTSATYEKIIGTRATAQASTWIFRDGETGLPATYQITPAVFDINTVLHSEIFTYRHFPDPIGYLVLDRFLGTTENELDQVVAEFSQGQVSELILDLRYNGGGLVYAAAKLASQILGPDAAGEMLMEFRHNDKYTEFDFSVDFEALDAH
ncbi:MAG: S41 family peptidase, partial [Pseudomonadota bacterium]